MPGRNIPLVKEQIYHVFNRGIDHRPTYTCKREYQRALETIKYYRYSSPPVKLAVYFGLGVDARDKIIRRLQTCKQLVTFLSYCFMPNHFHFLLKQETEDGISKFMSNFQNSYTRYFNIFHERKGPLFLDQFKAVRVETDDQLLHLSRYILLNPYSSCVVKSFLDVETYPWSSIKEYFGGRKDFCEINLVMSFFKSSKAYKDFVLDQADYQRRLEGIKHLSFDFEDNRRRGSLS